MRTSLLATLAAAVLLGWSLPVDVDAAGQGGAGGSTSTDLARGGGQPAGAAGGAMPGARPETPGGAGGAAAGGISDEQLDAYVQARRQIESQYPDLKQALESGDLSAERSRLEPIFSGSSMSVDEFIRMHRQVQSDPALRSRAEARLSAPGTTGTAAPGAQTQPGWRGGPTNVPPAGGAATSGPSGGPATGGPGAPPPSGAQPGASPQ